MSQRNGPWVIWHPLTTKLNDTFIGEPGHTYAFYSIAHDNVGNTENPPQMYDAFTTIGLDTIAPTTTLQVGSPFYINSENDLYVTSNTSFILSAENNIGGTGIDTINYQIRNATNNFGWINTISSVQFYLTGLSDGLYFIDFYSIDNAGNIESTNTTAVILDNTVPFIIIEIPSPWEALQDGVTFSSVVTDSSSVDWVKYAIREPGGTQGTIIDSMYESLVASLANDDKWQLLFDTTQLDDESYVLFVNASDNLGNIGYTTVNFSIRNWAVLENLPNTPNSKAGRTMPVKFSLRVVAAVDPTEPFVRNEELTILIYEETNPGTILQTSAYGSESTDYRISSTEEQYITNFQTLSAPKTYVVEIWRIPLLIGSFEFATVK